MIERVQECICPERKSCRGCSYSYNPALYDGGCKLYYEGVGAGQISSQNTPGNGAGMPQKQAHIQTGDIAPAREERSQ